ncbi:MAG: hypothetical protein ACKO7B_18115, partial [Flavobacteriales bacterium]
MKTDYILRMPNPSTHYFEVEMKLSGLKDKKNLLKMASWTPGSYLIREYARNVEQLRVEDASGKPVPFRKMAKNTWEIDSDARSELKVNYLLYANEMAVRNCYLDAEQAYLNGAAVFLYLKGAEQLPASLRIETPAEFAKIVTALKPSGKSGKEFQIENLDE